MKEVINPLILKWSGGEQLNELLSYTMEGEKSVVLHMQKVDAKALELFPLFRNALQVLADKIGTGEKFTDTEDVLMFSWAVTKFEALVRKVGFDIDESKSHPLYEQLSKEYKRMSALSPTLRQFKDIEPSLAVMKKETFLRQYANEPKLPNEGE